MARNRIPIRLLSAAICAVLALGVGGPEPVQADAGTGRQKEIEITYTEFNWWLIYWQDDVLACELRVDHPREPTGDEIYIQCGEKLYNTWLGSAPCSESESRTSSSCSGMYLHQVGSQLKTRTIKVDLPEPDVRIKLKDCISVRGTDLCAELPSLLITAEEPLPNESITRVQGILNEIPFLCFGDTCEVPLRQTGLQGVNLEFWADSSFGDSSTHYRGRIRVAESQDEIPFTAGWRVDIVSDQVDINNMQGCAKIWQSFPPLGTPPAWMKSPPHAFLLRTDVPYTYLAGQLIRNGYVEVDNCDDFGLTTGGYASQCGLEASRDLVSIWQNTFDEYIVEAAEQAGLPATLLKRIFAKESQFWPETTRYLYLEYGFGHINELGADTTLLWNKDFYDQFCPLILKEAVCREGYSQLDDWSQILLRGALLSRMEVQIPYGDADLDEDQLRTSLALFTETILGNCAQVGRLIDNELDRIPGEVASYEDLWRFTLVNYHGGSGCLGDAIIQVNDDDQSLDWEHISAALDDVCPGVPEYIDEVIY